MLFSCVKLELLYLPTQIRFLIGGGVTCHWSKLNDALGRTKLNHLLGTLDAHVIKLCTLKPRGVSVPVGLMLKSHLSRTTVLIGDGIQYSRKGIYSRKNISCRLTKGKIWTFCVSKLLVWRQKWVAHFR